MPENVTATMEDMGMPEDGPIDVEDLDDDMEETDPDME